MPDLVVWGAALGAWEKGSAWSKALGPSRGSMGFGRMGLGAEHLGTCLGVD